MNIWSLFDKNIFWIAFFAASLLFCWQLPHRRHFHAKFVSGIGVQIAVALIWSECFDNFSSQGVLLVCSRYVVHFLLLIVMVYLCYECDIIGATFCVMCGYLLQHIANRINTIIWRLGDPPHIFVRRISLFIILLVVCIAGYRLFKRRNGGVVNVIRIDAAGQLVVTAIALFAMNIVEMTQFLYKIPSDNFFEQISGAVQAIIFSCVVLMLEYNLLSYKSTEKERNDLKEIVREKRSQVEFERKMIETVNINAHDLKHKISEGYLPHDAQQDIMHTVEEFDTTLYTGNESLDIILTKKKRCCFQHGIQFICIADGQKLSFMGESDIFTLMGNILDNAIEAVDQLKDPDDRIIHLSIVGKNGFVHIRAENNFQGELTFSGKVPSTTKEDKEHHGYGIKSISLLVEKYGGDYTIFTENEMFILDILFPAQDNADNEMAPQK